MDKGEKDNEEDISSSEIQMANSETNTTYEYRLFSPLGSYPAQSLESELGHFIVTTDFITLVYAQNQPQNATKLLATLLLTTNSKQGFLKLYPLPFVHQIQSVDCPNREQIQLDILQKKQHHFKNAGDTIPEFEWYENAKGASLPRILGGMVYNTFDQLIDQECFTVVSQKLAKNSDKRLLMAFESLLTSNQLSCHIQFKSQASLYLLDGLSLLELALGKNIFDQAIALQVLSQLGENKEESLLARHQLSQTLTPIEYNKLFEACCHSLKNYLLNG